MRGAQQDWNAPGQMPGMHAESGPPGKSTHSEASIEHRILQGVSGSFLVSVATLPFGYLLSLILARVSPEAVGTYSVLGIYLSIVSTILYFGGGTVSVRFMAELPDEKRAPFFWSYFALTLIIAGSVSLVFFGFPELVRSFFGHRVSTPLLRALLLYAPIPLFYFATLAALRGLLRVTLAQALMRSLTLFSCVFYGYLLLSHPSFFQREYAKLIVGFYFVLMAILALVGFRQLWRSLASAPRVLQWYLPADFWSFALAVQVPSMLALMQQKIDEIFLLWALGISQLGIYFVLAQLAGASELLANFFLEGVFPGILNLQAAGKSDKTIELHARTAKYVLLIGAATAFFLIAFAGPLLRFLGPRYESNYSNFLLLLLFASLDALGPVNHTLLVGLKKMNSWTAVQTVRLVAFAALFALLARPLGLLGGVLAKGLAWILAGAVAYWIVLTRLPIKVAVPYQYFLYVALNAGLVGFCYLTRTTLTAWSWSLVLFGVVFSLFFFAGGFHFSEFRTLTAFVWSNRRDTLLSSRGQVAPSSPAGRGMEEAV